MATKPTLTLSALEKIDGAADPEPFTLGLKSKIVTFPDPFALSVEESERLMADLEGTTSIKATLTRYRRPITQDLAEQGWDMPALFRARRWTFLLDLIDGLPSHSRTISAILNDTDRAELMAETILAQEDEDDDVGEESTSLVGQTPEVRILQDIADILIATAGGKETYPRPVPVVTAVVEEMRTSQTLAAANDVIAILTPWALE